MSCGFMASSVGMGVSSMLSLGQLLAGTLCRVVGTFVGKMAGPFAIVLSLFLVLSVHGSTVGKHYRYIYHDYIYSCSC